MTDYISRQAENEKTYKLNSGETLVFNYNDNGLGLITVECMDAIIDRINSSVEVVRCKDCKYGEVDNVDFPNQYLCHHNGCDWNEGNHYCSYGEKL